MQVEGTVTFVGRNNIFDRIKYPISLHIAVPGAQKSKIMYVLTRHTNYQNGTKYIFDLNPYPTAPAYFADISPQPRKANQTAQQQAPGRPAQAPVSTKQGTIIPTETLIQLARQAEQSGSGAVLTGTIFYVIDKNKVPDPLKNIFQENARIKIETKAPVGIFPQQAQEICKFPALEYSKTTADGTVLCSDPRELDQIPGTNEYNTKIAGLFRMRP